MGKHKYKKHKSKSNTAKLTRQNATPSRAAGKVDGTRKKKDEGDRLQAFKAQMLSKHGDRVEVINKTSIKCLYQENYKKVLYKEFNMQNFDTYVNFGHKSKKKRGDIRMLLTMIGQTQDENADKQDSWLESSLVEYNVDLLKVDPTVIMFWYLVLSGLLSPNNAFYEEVKAFCSRALSPFLPHCIRQTSRIFFALVTDGVLSDALAIWYSEFTQLFLILQTELCKFLQMFVGRQASITLSG